MLMRSLYCTVPAAHEAGAMHANAAGMEHQRNHMCASCLRLHRAICSAALWGPSTHVAQVADDAEPCIVRATAVVSQQVDDEACLVQHPDPPCLAIALIGSTYVEDWLALVMALVTSFGSFLVRLTCGKQGYDRSRVVEAGLRQDSIVHLRAGNATHAQPRGEQSNSALFQKLSEDQGHPTLAWSVI